jgi:mRNA-degrading endonuclease RelE of RelBE toxin-antitoxin system
MTAQDIKSEIQKSLDRVPESVLQNVLDYLKQVENQSEERVKLIKNLKEILSEDKELLARLAK